MIWTQCGAIWLGANLNSHSILFETPGTSSKLLAKQPIQSKCRLHQHGHWTTRYFYFVWLMLYIRHSMAFWGPCMTAIDLFAHKKNDFKKSKSRLSVGSRPTSITNSFEIRQTLAFLPGLRRFGNLVWISNSTFLGTSTSYSANFQLILDKALFCTISINILQTCGPILNWNSWQGAANQMSWTWPTCFSIYFDHV